MDIDADCGNEDQATAQARDPWTDLDDGADEWADSSTPDCSGPPWVDIDADCRDGYQGDGSRSDETEVAAVSDEAQEGTYQEAVDRLLGNEPASDADPYSASGEGYEGALAQLEAEAAEREWLARLAAEEAEREWLAAEQQRSADANSYDAGGLLLGTLSGGIIRGLEDSGKLAPGASSALAGIAGLSQGSKGGFASGLNQSLNALNALSPVTPSYSGGGGANSCNGMNAEIERVTAKLNGNIGMCSTAREVRQVFTRAVSYYQNNNCPAESVQYSREMITWANQTERQACNR